MKLISGTGRSVMEKAVARAEMAEVVFKRGASAFAKGKYQETIEALTHCIDYAEYCNDTYADCVPVEALQIALEALGMRNIRCKEKLI